MTTNNARGKVQTVLGPVEPGDLGITLTHEHLLIDLECYFEPPEEASGRAWIHAPVTMDRLGGLGRRFAYNLDNMKLLDVQTAIEEVNHYTYGGGNALVDATSIGIARDPLALTRISRATGLHVIMGASHYVPLSHPPDMDTRTEQTIADEIIRDVTVGVGDTGVKAGIIGEIGNFWPTSENERKVLRASVHAQQETGAPILIHVGFHLDSPPAIMQTLLEAGADPQRIIMGHLDMFGDDDWLKSLADSGCYIEYDGFGGEDTSLSPLAGQEVELRNDVQRMRSLELLIERGFGDKIVIAHDVCTKHQYVRYGGKSFGHILDNIVPRMRKRGWGDAEINAILVENPRNVLTLK